jgi:hypothetical protein
MFENATAIEGWAKFSQPYIGLVNLQEIVRTPKDGHPMEN